MTVLSITVYTYTYVLHLYIYTYISIQQLKVEHKKPITTSRNQKQVVEKKQELEYENKREGHVSNIALTKKVFRLINSDTFYCESESIKDLYYFVRYEPYFHWCSCLDNSTRHVKGKHIFAIEYAIRKGTLKDIEHLPKETQRYTQVITAKSSYEEDEYDFKIFRQI
jgi:hypothetical protein